MNHYYVPVSAKKSTVEATTYPVRFPKPVYEAMKDVCEEDERSIAWFVNKVMVEHLKSIGRLPEDYK